MRLLLALALLLQVRPPNAGPMPPSTPAVQPPPEYCTATGRPSFGCPGEFAVAQNAPMLIKELVIDFSGSSNAPTEALVDPAAGAEPVGTWVPYNTGTFAFTSVGVTSPNIWLRNCYGRELCSTAVDTQAAGWATGEPAAAAYAIIFAGISAEPDSIPMGNWVLTPGTATTIVIRRDTPGGTILYSGAPAGLAAATFSATCADVAASPLSLYFTFTNGTGSIELAGSIVVQDFGVPC